MGLDVEKSKAEEFDQVYLLMDDGLDKTFLALLTVPVCRFASVAGCPLSIEILQAKAHEWISETPLSLAENWLELMLTQVNIDWEADRVLDAVHEVITRAEDSEWYLCPVCTHQLV
jgi:hypothetical protein